MPCRFRALAEQSVPPNRTKKVMEIRIECPHCGYVLSVFEEAAVIANRTMRRAYEHALKNPILCARCGRWVQRPKVDKVGK